RPNGDLDKMEPFMPSTPLNNLIDMELGPDGKLYFLEYGKGWFTANPEAAVSRIDYYSGDLTARAAAGGDASKTPLAVDSAEFEMGHQQHPEVSRRKKLVEILDCMNCHKTNEKSI